MAPLPSRRLSRLLFIAAAAASVTYACGKSDNATPIIDPPPPPPAPTATIGLSPAAITFTDTAGTSAAGPASSSSC